MIFNRDSLANRTLVTLPCKSFVAIADARSRRASKFQQRVPFTFPPPPRRTLASPPVRRPSPSLRYPPSAYRLPHFNPLPMPNTHLASFIHAFPHSRTPRAAHSPLLPKLTFPLMRMDKLYQSPPHQAHLLLCQMHSEHRIRMHKDQLELGSGCRGVCVSRLEEGPITSYAADPLDVSVCMLQGARGRYSLVWCLNR